MKDDFRNTSWERKERIRRIQTVVDLVKLDIEESSGQECITVDERGPALRKLFEQEQDTLQRTCTSNDWSKIYLMLQPNATTQDWSRDLKQLVSNTHFDGFAILDLTEEKTKNEINNTRKNNLYSIPPGLHSNLCVSNSIFCLKSCRVYRNSFISKTFVGANAVLMNCGQISSTDENKLLGTMIISVGAESGGGRKLSLTAESNMIDVCQQLKPEKMDNDSSSSSTPLFGFNVLSDSSIVCETSRLQNIFLYPNSQIEAAYSVTNAMLFENAQITTGSVVSNVLMQWNATISGNSTVNEVFMMEQSHLGPSSIVESTVMGPDAHASAGEIHASIFGPSTNAHHQSLLIGILWPLGRGNVAYGSNVGSNHTGRLPDQESSVGEGIFWGLSCVVKFPIDTSLAPYSMIAAGTKLSPQRITMPFSLIVESSTDACQNEIVPGWVLQHTPYTLVRNDKKFATRRKAKRHAYYTGWKILRASTVERCRITRTILQRSKNEDLSLENVPGIGDCVLTERARDGGIKNYTNCIQLYALRGLLSWLHQTLDKDESGNASVPSWYSLEKEFVISPETASFAEDSSNVEWPTFPWEGDEDQEWAYQRKLLVQEFPTDKKIRDTEWIRILLSNLLHLEKDLAERITKCKRRDDKRGAATVPGYADSHVLAEKDPVVIDAWEQLKTLEESIEIVLARLSTL